MGTKRRLGLHKQISSIFGGVPLAGTGSRAEGAAGSATTDKTDGYLPPRPSHSPDPPQIHHKESLKGAPRAANVGQAKEPGKLQKKIYELWKKAKTKLLTLPEGLSPSRHMAILVMIPLLLLVVVFVFGRLFLQSRTKAGGSTDSDTPAASVEAKTRIEWQKPAPYPDDLRDPMEKYSPSTATGAMTGDIVVRGIVWSQDRPAAVIGTQIVYEGQTIQGAKIVDITKDGVEFQTEEKTWTQKIAN